MEKEIQVQEEVSKESVGGGSGATVDANYVNKGGKGQRTREQKVNDTYILKQRIDYDDGLHDHDSAYGKLEYNDKDVENPNHFQQQLCDSVWKESEEQKRQRIDLLLFLKQQQKKEAQQKYEELQ